MTLPDMKETVPMRSVEIEQCILTNFSIWTCELLFIRWDKCMCVLFYKSGYDLLTFLCQFDSNHCQAATSSIFFFTLPFPAAHRFRLCLFSYRTLPSSNRNTYQQSILCFVLTDKYQKPTMCSICFAELSGWFNILKCQMSCQLLSSRTHRILLWKMNPAWKQHYCVNMNDCW